MSPPNILSTMPEAKHCTIGLDERIIYFGLDLGFPLPAFDFEGKIFCLEVFDR